MKIKKDIFEHMGEYLLAVVLGLFLGTIIDIVTQSLVWHFFPKALACRIAEAAVCLLVLTASICVTSGRIAYKKKRIDMPATIFSLMPILCLQLLVAFAFQFVSYASGAGYWIGVLFCHKGNGDSPYVHTPQAYFLLGMIVCMIVYTAAACVAQYIGYKKRLKSRDKMLNN